MKQVLLIDGSPLFYEFLKDKLKVEQVVVDTAKGNLDAYTKIISTLPDLIVIETPDCTDEVLIELLKKKTMDFNAKKIPVILTGPEIDRSLIANFVQYNVVKYFKKPIKFDVFFDSISKLLNANFLLDTTPCVLDIHINGSIIFVEIARGLNREKLFLLKYKLTELLSGDEIKNPKIVLMLTNLSLSFMDITNIELLFDNITAGNLIENQNIKVLSLEPLIKEIIEGHPAYYGIEVTENLNNVVNTLVESKNSFANVNDFVADKILDSSKDLTAGTVDIRFNESSPKDFREEGIVMKVAIVDDDVTIRKLLQSAFNSISAESVLFEKGTSFLQAVVSGQKFDLVILDIFIPDLDGFSILASLQRQNFSSPIIVYSQAVQKEAILQALSLGAKSYIVKPQKPNIILQKAVEVLNGQINR
ncbi:MAG: response regulator [Treponema sp.]|nr:response regulator [Treponema sp.]